MANEVAAPVGLNEAVIAGELIAEPESRELPSGLLAFSFSLTVRVPGEKTTSVPLVWYDPPAQVARWQAGDTVVARGSVVRRFYRGGGGLGSSTEVVVARASRTSAVMTCSKIVATATENLETLCS